MYELSCTKTGYIFRFNPTYSSTQPIVAFHGATICLYFILKMIVISVVNFNENCLKRFPTHWFQIVVIVILSNDVTIFLMVKKVKVTGHILSGPILESNDVGAMFQKRAKYLKIWAKLY